MNFTSVLFMFVFFPAVILGFYLSLIFENKFCFIKKIRLSDFFVILASILFYAWSIFEHVIYFGVYILILYILGLLIRKCKFKRVFMAFGVIFSLYVIFNYKYFALLGITRDNLIAPIGLSFITFSAISYIVDIYKNKEISLNIIDTYMYFLFFPKVVSGPIIKFKEFSRQIRIRTYSSDKFIEGVNQIIIGLAKKVIIADTFGLTIAHVKNYLYSGIDIPTAIGIVILYSLQLYYDFSGYSDMAIGLSKLFGFEFEKNFDYPYTSLSITEFWRRWHISLGSWFKEYVYIPLGGNRVGKFRTLINLYVVFILTGIWHGAGLNYIIWGAIHGFFRVLEKVLAGKKIYSNIPKSIKYIITTLIVVLCWQFFMFKDLNEIKYFTNIILGIKKFAKIPFSYYYYFNKRIIFLFVVAVFCATIMRFINFDKHFKNINQNIKLIIRETLHIGLFFICILFLINSTYSPFIYFQY